MAMRMTYEVPDDKIEHIGEMLKYTDNKSTQELMENAMALVEWAVEQAKSGREVVAINGNSGQYTTLQLPILEKASKR